MSTVQPTARDTQQSERIIAIDELEKGYGKLTTHMSPTRGGSIFSGDTKSNHQDMMKSWKSQANRNLVSDLFTQLRRDTKLDAQPQSERQKVHQNLMQDSWHFHQWRDQYHEKCFTNKSLAACDYDPKRFKLFGPTCVAMLTDIVGTPDNTNLTVCETKAKKYFEVAMRKRYEDRPAEAITTQDKIIANPWAIETCRTEASLDKDDTTCHCLASETEKSSTIQSIQDTFKGLKGRNPRSSAPRTGGGEEGQPLLAHEDSMASEQSES